MKGFGSSSAYWLCLSNSTHVEVNNLIEWTHAPVVGPAVEVLEDHVEFHLIIFSCSVTAHGFIPSIQKCVIHVNKMSIAAGHM